MFILTRSFNGKKEILTEAGKHEMKTFESSTDALHLAEKLNTNLFDNLDEDQQWSVEPIERPNKD